MPFFVDHLFSCLCFSLFIYFFGCFQEKDLEGKRPCPVCHQLRTANDRTPDGEIHRVLGRSNKTWCLYADDKAILEDFEKEQKERTQAAWRRANETKRFKKCNFINQLLLLFLSLCCLFVYVLV